MDGWLDELLFTESISLLNTKVKCFSNGRIRKSICIFVGSASQKKPTQLNYRYLGKNYMNKVFLLWRFPLIEAKHKSEAGSWGKKSVFARTPT